MSEKYFIEWSITGTTEIEAENADEATAKFEALKVTDLASDHDELDVLGGPRTRAERDAYWKEWMTKIFPKSAGAANG